VKNLLQKRHLRRIGGRFIVRATSPDARPGRKRKRTTEPIPDRKKEEELYVEEREENPAEENGISNRLLPPLFIPPLTGVPRWTAGQGPADPFFLHDHKRNPTTDYANDRDWLVSTRCSRSSLPAALTGVTSQAWF